ncbi:HNH endonuclease [Elioraea thermophila]|uniref:HNH endonuclease n=1 Tax=Elioraea thermophila TaxID=2185104 RepID=UPI000DF1F3C5|nr:HNH endonuclease [Elioraea thermophila]
MIEAPQGFVVAEECRKAAWQNGYRRALGQQDGWARYGSTTARGDIHLAAAGAGGPWYLALEHPGVIAELGLPPADMPGPGRARFAFATLGELYRVLPRVYALAVSLPDGPLQTFLEKTRELPRTTEAERLVVQRVGQDVFREGLMAYWGGRCPLTGITEPGLLRASHIKPWARCESDAERLDVHNGLLLSALWDAAFDAGLVTFEDDGMPLFAPGLSAEARAALRWSAPLRLTAQHREQLAWHRKNVFDVPAKAPGQASRGV